LGYVLSVRRCAVAAVRIERNFLSPSLGVALAC
jgi:hypothetical protein